MCFSVFLFFKQKTAYEMRISDWSSDVCSSDLLAARGAAARAPPLRGVATGCDLRHRAAFHCPAHRLPSCQARPHSPDRRISRPLVRRPLLYATLVAPAARALDRGQDRPPCGRADHGVGALGRSEEHTSELQYTIRNTYDVFCLKK